MRINKQNNTLSDYDSNNSPTNPCANGTCDCCNGTCIHNGKCMKPIDLCELHSPNDYKNAKTCFACIQIKAREMQELYPEFFRQNSESD